MKKKYMAIVLGMSVALASVTGCGSQTEQTQTTVETTAEADASEETEAQADVIYGEVASVTDTSVTIQVGTVKEGGATEKPDDANGADSAPDGMPEDQPSMLELDGTEQTITVTADTVITRQQMGGPQGGAPGEAGENRAPEKPDGADAPADGTGADGSAADKESAAETGAGVTDAAPEKPDDAGSMDKTDAEGAAGAPEQPGTDAASETLQLSDLEAGDTVAITLDADGNAAAISVFSMGGGMGQPGGAQNEKPDSYAALQEYTEDTELSGETIDSTGTDENAVLVSNGATVSIDDSTITRTSSNSTGGDSSSFYGVGAAVLVTDGTAKISDSTIHTDSAGGAGVFAYGDGVAYVSDSTIATKQDTAGGIHVAGGGTLYAWNLEVETNGESSAAIRSDRGSGTMVVDGGRYTSNGTGSPAVYSTADISIHNAELTANNSEAVCIEGLNSLRLYECDLTGSMQDLSQNDCTWNVILYQSMSGDSEVGNSTFEMIGGSLTAKNGGMFYTTNTESSFYLENVAITNADNSDFFLKCTGNENQRGWGAAGANGADCLFTAKDQEMEGDVIWDSISQLDFYLTGNSTLTGAFVQDESCAGNGGDGYANLYIGENSTWVVTGDSAVTNLSCSGKIVDADGNTVTVKGTDGTVYVKGDSSYTITVKSWSDSADLSGAGSADSWSDHEEQKEMDEIARLF